MRIKLKIMQNYLPKNIVILLCLGSTFISSCSKQLLDIKNQTYQSYNRDSEKGYIVNFELNNTAIVPKSIVINGIVQNVSTADKTSKNYQVNVIAQTTIIRNYQVKLEEKENGIYFEKDSILFFQPVKFKLITD